MSFASTTAVPTVVSNIPFIERIPHYNDDDDQDSSAPATPKRRKRGARKGKGPQAEDSLDALAAASQDLAREISKTSRPSSIKSSSSSQLRPPNFEPVSFFPVPTALCTSASASASTSLHDSASWRSKSNASLPLASAQITPPASVDPVPSSSSPAKKASKWKSFPFGKAHGTRTIAEVVEAPSDPRLCGVAMSATASNVSDLIMGLSSATAPPPTLSSKPSKPSLKLAPKPTPIPPLPSIAARLNRSVPQLANLDQSDADSETRLNHSRGRRSRVRSAASRDNSRSSSRHSNSSRAPSQSADHPAFHFNYKESSTARAVSPSSTYSAGQMSSGGSLSSAATSLSDFSRYSVGSARSLSTTATTASSLSSCNWRQRQSPTSPRARSPESNSTSSRNIKSHMAELPWEPHTASREHRPVSTDDNDSSLSYPRKHRSRKLKGPDLGTINERPGPPKSPRPLKDASTSTTDLGGNMSDDEGDGSRKSTRGQGNSLTKMLHLHVLRR
ncbi:hypothetical protein BDV98DRAFT_101209 [Pterulicium gracile]|uniref:Uncharacterized protein n=1 Tax=Pterulicium gracile TaxID=1884261 RepID=A0A5C3QEF6_9AGAR|nr:hypothetical protein BDV98DRAFT_101209 [Pterula gracilis]